MQFRSLDMAKPVGSLSWNEPWSESLKIRIVVLLVPGATLTTELRISWAANLLLPTSARVPRGP